MAKDNGGERASAKGPRGAGGQGSGRGRGGKGPGGRGRGGRGSGGQDRGQYGDYGDRKSGANIYGDPGSSDAPEAAPRTTEQLVASVSSAHGMSYGRREARGHAYELRGLGYVPVSRLYEGRFGRMFRLPPFAPEDDRLEEIAALMVEPGGANPGLDNMEIPAGYTYLGQFIDHDITFDPVSSLDRQNDPDALTNFRTPRFDLDSVYGRGPADDPFLYDLNTDRIKFVIGQHDGEDDLPRNDLDEQETALIGDPRNDENIFIAALQLTMLKFHNAVVDVVIGEPTLRIGSETVFEAAQRIVRWHYQWIVVHDFLPRSVGNAMVDEVFIETDPLPQVKRKFFKWKHFPYMPVEFSVAAYRFGHSQIRGQYKLNTTVPRLPVFKAGSTRDDRLGSFGGFRKLPPVWTIEWARFFEVGGAGDAERQQTRLIDTVLAEPLTTLPTEIGGDRPSLTLRNLIRGARLLLPSGQDVANHMGETPLSDADLGLPGGGPAPLWYYVLKEAEVQEGGVRLGRVGGLIVTEVLMGLLEADPSSYLRNQPAWNPFLPAATANDFTMADLLQFTGHGLGQT